MLCSKHCLVSVLTQNIVRQDCMCTFVPLMDCLQLSDSDPDHGFDMLLILLTKQRQLSCASEVQIAVAGQCADW